MGNLQRRRHDLDQDRFVARIELTCLAGGIVEQHIDFRRHSTSILCRTPLIVPGRIFALT